MGFWKVFKGDIINMFAICALRGIILSACLVVYTQFVIIILVYQHQGSITRLYDTSLILYGS